MTAQPTQSVTWNDATARTVLRQLFDAAVRCADPGEAVRRHLPERPVGRCVVVGAGKAAAAMAAALDAAWPDVDVSGVVVTRYGHAGAAGHDASAPQQGGATASACTATSERPAASGSVAVAATGGIPVAGGLAAAGGTAAPSRITVLEAAHPVPDEASVRASRRILQAVQGLTPDDLVVALISGGGSSLLTLPAAGMTLADKQAVNRALLHSGATIHEMNVVRRQLSAIKGGRLAQAAMPARLCTLIVSDVPGDDPAIIASGPTVADLDGWLDVIGGNRSVSDRETGGDTDGGSVGDADQARRPEVAGAASADPQAQAREIVARYGMQLPPAALQVLDTPQPPVQPHPDHTLHIIAAPMMSLQAAARAARDLGLTPLILGDALEGEAAQMGTVLAGIGRAVALYGQPLPAPAVLLSGGEATVTIGPQGAGRGGRNTECLLAMALALGAQRGVWALAADTDGIDGTEDAAGALIGPDTLQRARAAGLDPRRFLQDHDSYSFFAALNDLLITGPTGTNVNDFRAILIA